MNENSTRYTEVYHQPFQSLPQFPNSNNFKSVSPMKPSTLKDYFKPNEDPFRRFASFTSTNPSKPIESTEKTFHRVAPSASTSFAPILPETARSWLSTSKKRGWNETESNQNSSTKKFIFGMKKNATNFRSILNESPSNSIASVSQKTQTNLPPISPRLITGSIEKITKIQEFFNDLMLLYETFGKILRISNGKWHSEKQILIRQQTGPVLTLIFYEMDFHLPSTLQTGNLVRVCGRFIGPRRLQIFSIRNANEIEIESSQRLEILSEFTINKDVDAVKKSMD